MVQGKTGGLAVAMLWRKKHVCRAADRASLIFWSDRQSRSCRDWKVLASFQDAASVVLLVGTVRDTAAGLGSAWAGNTLVGARQGLRGGEPGDLVSAVARGRGVRRVRVTATS